MKIAFLGGGGLGKYGKTSVSFSFLFLFRFFFGKRENLTVRFLVIVK